MKQIFVLVFCLILSDYYQNNISTWDKKTIRAERNNLTGTNELQSLDEKNK